jgi:phosphoribosylformimino-5-aminoimidazole carboxamide ribotide isomerase
MMVEAQSRRTMLVIPAIEIEDHRCCRTIESRASATDELYRNDPVEIARLWRTENAKSIHVTDYDGLYKGRIENHDEIISIVQRVEVPVMLLARCADGEECRRWLDGGVYRLVVHDLILREPETVRALIEEYGGSRVVAGAITRSGAMTETWRPVEPVDTLEFAALCRELGFRRIFFTDRDYEGVMRGPNFEELTRIAQGGGLPITSAGGVATVEHLWRLQELERDGVDSVVIGRAFYENKFPCQQLWRDVELERRRDDPKCVEEISTSKLAQGDA